MMMVLKVRASGSTPCMVQSHVCHAILPDLLKTPQGCLSGGHACHLSRCIQLHLPWPATVLCFEMTVLEPASDVA